MFALYVLRFLFCVCQVAETLLEKGISLEMADKYGCTPLHYACLKQQTLMGNFILGKTLTMDIIPLPYTCLKLWHAEMILIQKSIIIIVCTIIFFQFIYIF